MDIDDLFAPFETINVESAVENGGGDSVQKRKREEDIEPPSKIQHVDKEINGEPHLSEEYFHFPTAIKNSVKRELMSTEVCKHEVVHPPSFELEELPRTIPNAAKTYPFELDPFQKEALLCLEANQSVLVSAHTSAGKTVIAEYAIAMCLCRTQKVIYTTPIKALSNQKFREFEDEFTPRFGKDAVGLMTGDVTTNPKASCLVMTTEILRNMLLKGSDILDGVAWVIYDEVHYMRDKERGLVWEESMILMPDTVRFIFLSATIPNAMQFANWVSWMHCQPCHVVSTSYRPVPLEFNLFPVHSNNLFTVLDAEGNFSENNFRQAMNTFSNDRAPEEPTPSKKEKVCSQLVGKVKEQNLMPTIVFVFSKRGCETGAADLNTLDFNNAEEKIEVTQVYEAVIDKLSDDDKNLKEVQSILPLLRRGIGTHHAGMLPFIREVVELLFGKGLIKVLFATETFSMGLNMPARSVIFDSLRKYDGGKFRWLSTGEFIQMSGRAGRRGLDAKGTVMVAVNREIPQDTLKNYMKGDSEPLHSAYHITYHSLLSMLRRREINPTAFIAKTFLQFQKWANNDFLIQKQQEFGLELRLNPLVQEDLAYLNRYKELTLLRQKNYKKIKAHMLSLEHCHKVLVPNRVVKIITREGKNFGWCWVVKYEKTDEKDRQTRELWGEHRVRVIAEISKTLHRRQYRNLHKATPATPKEKKERNSVFRELTARVEDIAEVQTYRGDPPPTEGMPQYSSHLTNRRYLPEEAKNDFLRAYKTKASTILTNPIKTCRIKSKALEDLVKEDERLRLQVARLRKPNTDAFKRLSFESILEVYRDRCVTQAALKRTAEKLKNTELLTDMKHYMALLQRLDFVEEDDLVQMKGTVACEILGADEILLTELLFSGHFNALDLHQTSALLSCFVFQEKNEDDDSKDNAPLTKEKEDLQQIFSETLAVASKLALEAQTCGLELLEPDYIQSFQPHMMEVVSGWSQGQSLAEVLQQTSIQVGSIVRCLRKLEDLLQQMVKAAQVMGNPLLMKKFEQCANSIRRGIPFDPSIYTE